MVSESFSVRVQADEQVSLAECTAELLKDAVHSAVISPLNSILQMAGKPKLDVLTPDLHATGMKAAAGHAGEMAGTVFDFMALRAAAGLVVGESIVQKGAANLLQTAVSTNLEHRMAANALAGFGQGYLFSEVQNGNAHPFSIDRLEQGAVGAASMMVMDRTQGLGRWASRLSTAERPSSLFALGNNALAGGASSISQVELGSRFSQGHWATGHDVYSAAFGGAVGGMAFHAGGALLGRLNQPISMRSYATGAAALKSVNSERFRTLLAKAPLELSPKSLDVGDQGVLSAYVKEPSGRVVPVVVRYGNRLLEEQAYNFHQLTDFETTVPRTVHRDIKNWGPEPARAEDGIDVQQRVGKSIATRVAKSKTLVVDAQLRDQLEQATAERMIIGDKDGHDGNMTVLRKGGKWSVGNIDFSEENGVQGTFSEGIIPPSAQNFFVGQSISEATLAKIRSTSERLRSSEGNAALREIGFNDGQIHGIITRADTLYALKRFPLDVEDIAEDVNLPAHILDEIATADDADLREAVAHSPIAGNALLAELAYDEHYRVRNAVASNPSANTAILHLLAEDSDPEVRISVADNPNLNSTLLNQLAQDPVAEVREAVAAHPASPSDLLVSLAQDHESSVRAKIAGNPNTPAGLLDGFAASRHALVRAGVGANPEAPVQLLQRLSTDHEYSVRESVAANPATSPEIVRALSIDANPFVRRKVIGRADLDSETQYLMSYDDPAVQRTLALNPDADTTALYHLARQGDRELRAAVARNPAITEGIFALLKNDEQSTVREHLARNLGLTRKLLVQLASDTNINVREKLVDNPRFWEF